MKLHFHGGAGMVTGSNYLLETAEDKILIDCGLFQGEPDSEKRNLQPFSYRPADVDSVLITHAHLDHIGLLPKLVGAGFQGKIFATAPTVDFAHLLLKDSQKILREKAMKADVIPLMDEQRVETVMKMFEQVEYDQPFKVSKNTSVCFKEAGHVLGSAMIEIISAGKKIVFTGDLGSGRMPLLRKPAIPKDADYIIMESTYGDRCYEAHKTSEEMIEDVVEKVINRGGVLMIPSFALERTQKLLYHFNSLVENHRIPEVPIFVDSPLAIKLTKAYCKYPQYYSKQADLLIKSGDDIFKFPGLKFTLTTRESKAINRVPPPKIIIAGSGMSQGGRIIHHEVRYLRDPKNMLLIVTYQARGTLGRKILEGARRVEILDRNIRVRAEIEHLNGFSSHADQKELLTWVTSAIKSGKEPEKIFVCHGEKEPSRILAQKISEKIGIKTEIPRLGQVFEL